MSLRSLAILFLALAGAAHSGMVGDNPEKRSPQGGRPDRPGRPGGDPGNGWGGTSTYEPWTPPATPINPPPATTYRPTSSQRPQQPYTPPVQTFTTTTRRGGQPQVPSQSQSDNSRPTASPPLNLGDCRQYTCQQGDTCEGLARQFGMSLQQFKQRNNLGDPYDCVIYANQILCV